MAELSARYRVPVVVQDLALRELRLSERPVPATDCRALTGALVIGIGSVSKVLWAGLRIGWIRAPHAVVERLTRLKIAADMGTSVLSQHIAARVLPSIDEATEERRRHLIEGYDALSGALSEHLPEWTWETIARRGGCTLWVRLPSGDARAFGQVAQRCGVNVVPGQVLSAEGGHGDRLRIPFVHEPPVIAEAVRRMATAWDLYAGRGSRMEREESLIVCGAERGSDREPPLHHGDRPSREPHALAPGLDIDDSPAPRGLVADEPRAAEPLGPVRPQGAVRRAGHRVLRHADAGEETRNEVGPEHSRFPPSL